MVPPSPLDAYGLSFIDVSSKTDTDRKMLLKSEDCLRVIEQAKRQGMKPLGAHSGGATQGVESIRTAAGSILESNEETAWIYNEIQSVIRKVLKNFWPFEVTGMQPLQIMRYSEGNKYAPHIDIGPRDGAFRKLSFTLQLSAAEEYEGGELAIHADGEWKIATKEQGSYSIFPSYILHEVRPVLSGQRWALVGWFIGDKPFK